MNRNCFNLPNLHVTLLNNNFLCSQNRILIRFIDFVKEYFFVLVTFLFYSSIIAIFNNKTSNVSTAGESFLFVPNEFRFEKLNPSYRITRHPLIYHPSIPIKIKKEVPDEGF